MSIARFAVQRPVTIVMFFMLCVLLGVISWTRLPQELFPPLTFPQLTIVTVYENAAPEEVENLITKVIEEAIGTVKNLQRVSSISKEGASLVTAEFSWDTSMDFASLGIREKLDQIKEQLPPDCKEPIVIKYNPLSKPVVILNVTGKLSQNELLQLSEKIIKDRLEKTKGVASIELSGGQERQILVDVDQSTLLKNQISLVQVVDAIKNTNINYPAGTTNDDLYEYLIRTIGEYTSIEQMKETVIETTNFESQKYKYKKDRDRGIDTERKQRQLVRLGSLSSIAWGYKERASYSRYNGVDTISVSIRKRSEANTIQTAQDIKRTIDGLRATLKPHGVSLDIVYDQSVFIKGSINGLIGDALQGGLLAFFVILYFLNSFFLAVVVSVSIPISITIAISAMYFSNITINMMSLGGLALGVGMLVDNSIVVIENIFRHRSLGAEASDAAVAGTDEMAGPIASSTLTTVAVFLPLLFVTGIAGQIFKELSLTVTYSLLASLIVAIALVPRLTAGLRRGTEGAAFSGVVTHAWEGLLSVLPKGLRAALANKPAEEQRLVRWYRGAIEAILDHRMRFLKLVTAVFVVSLFVAAYIPKGFIPQIDQRQFLVSIDMPAGTRLDVTNEITKKVEALLHTMPQVKNVMTQVGATSEQALETLKQSQAQLVVDLYRSRGELPPERRSKAGRFKKTVDVMNDLNDRVDAIHSQLQGAQVSFATQGSSFESIAKRDAPLIVEVQGQDMSKLMKLADDVIADMRAMKGVVNITDDRPVASPETRIQIDKDKAATYTLSVADIAKTALIALKGLAASKFKEAGEEFDIRVRLSEKDRVDLASLQSLLVYAPAGFNVYIKEVAHIIVGQGPSEIKRINQQRTITISAGLHKLSLKKAVALLDKKLDKYKKLAGYAVTLSGESAKIRESFASLGFMLLLSIVLVYMIMAAQFESFYQPFIILFTIPLAVIGVVAALLVTFTSMNAIALMGVVILGGIVVNNGIVLIDYVNQLRARGEGLRESVVQAAVTRLRPILLTAGTTVLGLLPLALGLGEGAELRAPMAITVIGGLTVSTVLTLGVIPAIYISIEEWKEKRKKSKFANHEHT